MRVGVFDSGLGGLSVAQAIRKALPECEVVLREDHDNVPYGTKLPKQLLSLVVPIFSELVADGCEIIVVACNTVSTTLIDELRAEFDVPLIAVEPMVKSAAKLSRSGVIAVCATPTTLTSKRYQQLTARYAQDIVVLEPDCHDWSQMIEHEQIDELRIRHSIESVLEQKADVIVLGCTHYHWIEHQIKDVVGNQAQVLQPEPIIVSQVRQLLEQQI